MQKLSLLQRIGQETPPFWRGVQLLCLVLAFIVDHLAQKGFIPGSIQLVADGAFAFGAFIAQFAIKNPDQVKEVCDDPAAALNLIPGLLSQVTELAQLVKNPPVVTLGTIEQAAKQLKPMPDYIKGGIVPDGPVVQQPASPGLGAWPQGQSGADQQNQNSDPGTQNQ